MLSGSEGNANSLQDLSALADGELDAAATLRACAHWRGDAQARSAWHAYQLIGDVMRSEELASGAARDAAFLRGVAARLAAEPVVLAPQPVALQAPAEAAAAARAMAPRGRWSWMAPAAVAAGFMAVASVLVVTREAAPGAEAAGRFAARAFGGNGTVATAQAPMAAGLVDSPVDAQMLVADGQLMRDARLDRYLAAHKQFGGSSALGVPSGFLRAATTQTPNR